MGGDGENLPTKALMFLCLCDRIISFTNGIDSNDPMHEMLLKKAEECLDQCFIIINNHKDDSDE